MREEIVKCNECGGSGKETNHAFGVFTLGIGYVLQGVIGRFDCEKCDGRGYIIVRLRG